MSNSQHVEKPATAPRAKRIVTKPAAKPAPPKAKAKTPVQVLFGGRNADTPLLVFRYTQEGVELSAVKEMLSHFSLYTKIDLLVTITGNSLRTAQRMLSRSKCEAIRLNPQQSTVAFQYAQVLEHATHAFGSQELAEDWLRKPSKFLDGLVPLDMIANAQGFQAVEDYLERMVMGVYQ
ncbi:DUF2384 domain-containing protein [Pseudomonas aeruginosa]|uniref:antitoxin Xre/MbcA/ParS toxin-binding domain-containing protein n=1 Tax=Pseudomonas aeruginosa TaxID=287 RepID=UPI00214DAEF9|nr:antitoxin Xre/MbcA/ParS toxin-binding domain-containing protein [Pseudomonas aeruginosa]MCR3806872.1 DUF2384 domain-containing protein [Pseudomonas aeruginosa]MCW4647238.1 DUF2384 domain-containing protein [Pseudomonas aeruginosa]